MKGIHYVVDDKGHRTAVVIDLKKHGAIWEDMYDRLTAEQRKNEPRESIKSVKGRLRRRGKLPAETHTAKHKSGVIEPGARPSIIPVDFDTRPRDRRIVVQVMGE